jgi:hypothetical protein
VSVQEFRDSQSRRRRGPASESGSADETQPTIEVEVHFGSDDAADAGLPHGTSTAGDVTSTASEEDSSVNDQHVSGEPSPPSSSPDAGSPGSGQGSGAAQPDYPADGDADDPRRTAHELVAQAQALLHIASQDPVLSLWWPRGVPDVGQTFPELALKAGQAQAEIASGRYDERLAARVGNTLGRPKRHLLRRLLVKIQGLVHTRAFDDAVKWIKPACGAASSALGSMSFIPGVGAIQEAIDLIGAGLETVEQLGGPTVELPDKPPRETGTNQGSGEGSPASV